MVTIFIFDVVTLQSSHSWTDAPQHGIYLFYITKKQTTTVFLFQNISQLLESRPLPTLANTKNAIWRNLLSLQNEAISLVAMRSTEGLVIGPQINIMPLSSLTQMASRGLKTHSESRIELRNLLILKKMLEKSTQFCHQSTLVIRRLGICFEYCRSWKKKLGKLAVAVNSGRHLIWTKGGLSTVEICVLCS